ncbi:MAG: hypothetical protein EOP43_00060 [Sphingobacteriaceae bacterium]|nr:MAG: hypothetical protein EOP43_00060 [Sphingobacteriaceae bacterium]
MKKIIPNLFFLFLTSPILSPSVGGITIYISAIILFFDFYFLKWFQKNITKKILIETIFFLVLMLLASRSLILVVKSIILLFSVVYTYYCYNTNKFYLYRWVAINICVALIQFLFVFINPDFATFIGPTNIANSIWGEYAGPTFTNFYSISILPRVSGLSREGGFFASLLGVTFFLFLYDKRQPNKSKKFYFILFILGLLISLSKTSIFILVVPLIIGLRRYINILGVFGLTTFYSIITTLICYYININTHFFIDISNITFLQRFAGYIFAPYAHLVNFFIGIKLPDLLSNYGHISTYIISVLKETNSFEFCGLPYFYLGYGVLSFLVFLLYIVLIGFDATSTALIILLTTNVTPLTNDGFVVLAWLLGFILSRNKKSKPNNNNNYILHNKLNYNRL